MIIVSRLLARVIAIALAVLIAAAGIAAAVFCIGSGHGTLSLPGLASDLHLPQLRADVDYFLNRTTRRGSVAVLAALGGAAAILLGLMLLAGCWISPRPLRIVLARTSIGCLATRRRALAHLARDHAAACPQIARSRARAWPRRSRDGGRVRLRVRAASETDRRTARQVARDRLQPFDGLPVEVTVRARRATRHDRHQAAAEAPA